MTFTPKSWGNFATGGTPLTGASLIDLETRLAAYADSIVGSSDLGIFNVKSPAYGAVGNGSTNDSAAIQAAIDDATVKGGVVYVPPSAATYRANIIMKAGVTLTSLMDYRPYIAVPVGASPAVIESVSGASGWVIDTPSAATYGTAIVGIGVKGYSNGSSGTGGIRFRNTGNGIIKKVAIHSCDDQGILQVAGGISSFEDIILTQCLMNRTRASQCGVVDLGGTDHYLSNIEANAGLSNISSASLFCAGIRISGDNNFIHSGCNGEFSDIGWYVDGNFNRFDGPRGDLNYGHGFVIAGQGNQFSVPFALSNGQAAANTYDGFLATNGNNTFVGAVSISQSSSHKYGFEDTVVNSLPAGRNHWIDPTSYGYGTAAFSGATFSGSSPLYSPVLTRLATSTTPNVEQSSLFSLVDFSTPTTITNFLNGTNGTYDFLGKSGVTIANNSTIKTRTGASRALADNLMYQFTYIDGVWYEAA